MGASVLDRAPDLIEAVIGFRQWRMEQPGVLLSLHSSEVWEHATLRARCPVGHDHEVPGPACSCGIYAWYRPCPRTGSAGTRDLVAGAVALWGEIELHATGMRASHCRIVAFALPLSHGDKRRRLLETADALGVPAVPHRELRRVAARHGAAVPDQLKPRRASVECVGVVPRAVDSLVSFGRSA
ncbi:MAG TPA: hypothetical protein VNS09_20530 [Solirubrobacter sp.]|nr:hypothetical protein [Solirubrobacter sp.]